MLLDDIKMRAKIPGCRASDRRESCQEMPRKSINGEIENDREVVRDGKLRMKEKF